MYYKAKCYNHHFLTILWATFCFSYGALIFVILPTDICNLTREFYQTVLKTPEWNSEQRYFGLKTTKCESDLGIPGINSVYYGKKVILEHSFGIRFEVKEENKRFK